MSGDEHIEAAEVTLDLVLCNGPEVPDYRAEAICVIAAALAKAEQNGAQRALGRVRSALSDYRSGLNNIPLGHETPTRGASTYNWKVSVYEEIFDIVDDLASRP